MDYRGKIPGRTGFLFMPPRPDRLWGPSSLLPNGYQGSFPSSKPEGGADHSSSSSVDVNAWSYTSTSPYVFMAWYLVKHRDKFTFTFIIIIIIYLHYHPVTSWYGT
jgi:hypothetical protein